MTRERRSAGAPTATREGACIPQAIEFVALPRIYSEIRFNYKSVRGQTGFCEGRQLMFYQ
jgi:hypothetical protein